MKQSKIILITLLTLSGILEGQSQDTLFELDNGSVSRVVQFSDGAFFRSACA